MNDEDKGLSIKLFATFGKIGLFTIGGGYAMIPLIEEEVIEKHKWIDHEQFVDVMAIAQSVPGIFAVNISIFVGYKLRGLRGSIAAMLGCVLPSFLIIVALALFFQEFKQVEWVERVFKGIRPATVALITAPIFKMLKTAKINWYNCWIPIVAALTIWLLGVSPIYIIILSAVGSILYFYGKQKMKGSKL